jgi:hypothetical protein
MDKNYISNCPLQAPGLAVGGDTTTAKTANTFSAKAKGIISLPFTTADMPALDTSIDKEGNTGAIVLADGGYQRVYTLLASIDPVSAVMTFSWVHSADFPAQPFKTGDINQGNAGDEDKAIIGYLCIQTTGSGTFTPGTDDINSGDYNYVFIDNFGFVGA